jgi:hypothetical protein
MDWFDLPPPHLLSPPAIERMLDPKEARPPRKKQKEKTTPASAFGGNDRYEPPVRGKGLVPLPRTLNGGLPAVLFDNGSGKVVHGTDPGDYYCEHAFFSLQLEATKTSTSLITNVHGEPLVGFLHVPAGPYSDSTDGNYAQEIRHRDTREIIGCAIRGFYSECAREANGKPVRIAITGYGPFSSIKDNATGDFVARGENIDAAMAHAFGKGLLTPRGKWLPRFAIDGVETCALRYRVRDPKSGRDQIVVIHTQRLPVDDRAIDGETPMSIQQLIRRSKAQAVISMGVHSRDRYHAEHHADDGALAIGRKGTTRDTSISRSNAFPSNYALARAIHSGSQAAK